MRFDGHCRAHSVFWLLLASLVAVVIAETPDKDGSLVIDKTWLQKATELGVLIILASAILGVFVVLVCSPAVSGHTCMDIWNEVAPYFLGGLILGFFALEAASALVIVTTGLPDLRSPLCWALGVLVVLLLLFAIRARARSPREGLEASLVASEA
mmetsp:Transcript_98186/g.194463  ORF Transcript_98186/g.194463 Transcript_98186/m.194463 type:complete len:155 (+) Transcript_98186:42-506(+)|eukprot:CAMPEP_0172868436 /NCGR_PEP_ID=MMETSP1075-20121228/86319_1 /TAXON_ID=2916 /ORGANISM="Ceratium fusus, Strain PA161109" /LENGTH=154 /DNA_ID=CAMNT_0013718067 /DNA_START=30 /DNA_END=494 /DNA_ORIENTATION=+